MMQALEKLLDLAGDNAAVLVTDGSGELIALLDRGSPPLDPVVAAATLYQTLTISANAESDALIVAHFENASAIGEHIGGHFYVAVTAPPAVPALLVGRLRAAFRDLSTQIDSGIA